MKVRCFYPNKEGKISFTKEELEKLLDEVYSEGWNNGWAQGYQSKQSTIVTYPSNIPYTPVWYGTEVTCETTNTTNTLTIGDEGK